MYWCGSLLAVAAALALSACSNDDDAADEPTAKAGCAATKQAAAPGTSSRRYTMVSVAGGEVARADLNRTIDIICARAGALGIEVRGIGPTPAEGADQLQIDIGDKVDEEKVAELTGEGRLDIYDWEPNLVTEPGAISRPAADALAARNPGSIVVDDRSVDPATPTSRYVIRDRPALSNEDIRNARYTVDSITTEPAVSFDLTPAGAAKFQALTKGVAERGHGEPEAEHFGVVFDGEVLGIPAVNSREYPQGISGEKGVTLPGVLNGDQSSDVASILEIGPLPVALIPTAPPS